jgi:hypothetical protein
MAEDSGESRDSVELVYGLARVAYRDQFAQRDQQRTRCGTLLAFTGILATLSTTAAHDARGSLLIFVGIIALIASAGLFLLQILGNTVSVIRRNERTLQRADSLFGFAVLLLFLGTLFIGARVALLLL